MKRVGKRILALFLCACLCVGFMPTIPALALANGSNNVVEVAEMGKLEDSFEGLVFEFHDLKASEGKDAVRLDIYTHVTQEFQAFNARLAYDSSSVVMTDTKSIQRVHFFLQRLVLTNCLQQKAVRLQELEQEN